MQIKLDADREYRPAPALPSTTRVRYSGEKNVLTGELPDLILDVLLTSTIWDYS